MSDCRLAFGVLNSRITGSYSSLSHFELNVQQQSWFYRQTRLGSSVPARYRGTVTTTRLSERTKIQNMPFSRSPGHGVQRQTGILENVWGLDPQKRGGGGGWLGLIDHTSSAEEHG
jgi:hypothetical protein